MRSNRKNRSWKVSIAAMAWPMAVIGAVSSGIFLGSNFEAHSDMAKYESILAQHERAPAELIVRLSKAGKASAGVQSLDAILNTRIGVRSIEAFETNNEFYLVKLNNDQDMAFFMEEMESNPSVQYAEPNYIVKALGDRDADSEVLPNDTDFDKLWGMKNVGQKDSSGQTGKVGADIGATKAWTTTTGNKDVLVAVIDTGVDYTHDDLVGNIYMNPGESGDGKETNGIDDDGNGFVDDFHGWNFAGVSNNNPMDDNDHGTHVSGTIGGMGNNAKGVAGVNWNTSILPVKFLTGGGSGTLADAVKAIQYATLMNAHVMNNSWGGGGFTQTMFDAITAAKDKGLLFIAAAGNDSSNSDRSPHYPAGYQIENVIAVAATTNTDALATFSTYGKRTVHIAAPGHKIYSTIPGNQYDTFSGTSMATPHVAGAAALLWGTSSSMPMSEVKDRLLRSRDFIGHLARKVASGGRLNIYNAINGIYPPSPEPSESDWRDMSLPAPIESAHPYDNSFTQEWTIDGPANAKYMRVIFSKVDLEDRYDFVRVVDANGEEMDAISGKAENLASFYVSGNKLKLRFTTDSSQTKWGFAVSKVQVVE
ncbi:MAG: S8 family serine peptidase [Oligoflexia bacterium]|nr:S8 family serine peptidase [Oligoflexia bacterium]